MHSSDKSRIYQSERTIREKKDQLDKDVKKALALCALTRSVTRRNEEKGSFSKTALLDKKNSSESEFIDEDSSDEDESRTEGQTSSTQTTEEADTEEEIESFLMIAIEDVVAEDDVLIKLKQAKANDDRKLSAEVLKKGFKVSMRDLTIKDDLLYFKNRLVVLNSSELRLRLLKRHHDSLIEGYLDYKAMFHVMSSNYF
jgi:hypothetical protein